MPEIFPLLAVVVKMSKMSSLTSWPWKIQTDTLSQNVASYPMLCNNPKEWRSRLHCGRNLKSAYYIHWFMFLWTLLLMYRAIILNAHNHLSFLIRYVIRYTMPSLWLIPVLLIGHVVRFVIHAVFILHNCHKVFSNRFCFRQAVSCMPAPSRLMHAIPHTHTFVQRVFKWSSPAYTKK